MGQTMTRSHSLTEQTTGLIINWQNPFPCLLLVMARAIASQVGDIRDAGQMTVVEVK